MDGKDVVSGGDIAYGKTAVFSIVSNSNYKLGAIKQGSSDVDISKIAGTYADGKTSYTYTTSELTAGAGYTFVFISKDTVKFVANNLTQMEGSIKQVTVASDIKDIKIEYQVNGTTWIKELPSTLKAGSYKAPFYPSGGFGISQPLRYGNIGSGEQERGKYLGFAQGRTYRGGRAVVYSRITRWLRRGYHWIVRVDEPERHGFLDEDKIQYHLHAGGSGALSREGYIY